MNKRIVVLILSISTITCYGYALGGLGTHIMIGRGGLRIAAAGLAGGTFCAWLALKLWRQFLDEEDESQEKRSEDKSDPL